MTHTSDVRELSERGVSQAASSGAAAAAGTPLLSDCTRCGGTDIRGRSWPSGIGEVCRSCGHWWFL